MDINTSIRFLKILVAFLFVLFISSCERNKENLAYYNSGNIKSENIYENDSLIKTIIYYDSIERRRYKETFRKNKYDSIVYYYFNGNVFRTGNKDFNGNLFGKWHYYTREGILSETQEYVIINGDYELNQRWYYNKKGDTMFYGNNDFNVYKQKEFEEFNDKDNRSIFVRFNFYPEGDTISIAEPFRGLAEDGFPFWQSMGSKSYVVIAKEKFNFNDEYSNENEVKLDTFNSLEKDKLNKNSFPKANQKHTVAFGRWFDTPGEKIIRGYMVESCTKEATPQDSITGMERRTYFEKRIYVKDTIKK